MLDFNMDWTSFAIYRDPLIDPDEVIPYIDMTINIIPDWNTSVYLDWQAPSTDDIISYMIYYSENEAGPFLPLTAQPITDLHFFTLWERQDSRVFEQFFTIESIYDDGRKFRSYPTAPSAGLSKWHLLRHRDIIRRERILLDKFVGVETIIFNPKYHGMRCKECWDTEHLKVTNDHCESCYGTSYEGGYDTGMRILMQYTSIDPQSSISYNGRVEPITISAWTISYPLLFPDAIVLRVEDRRLFEVAGHQGSTEMRTNMQRQNVVLQELGRDSIENKLFNLIGVEGAIQDIMPRKPHVHH